MSQAQARALVLSIHTEHAKPTLQRGQKARQMRLAPPQSSVRWMCKHPCSSRTLSSLPFKMQTSKFITQLKNFDWRLLRLENMTDPERDMLGCAGLTPEIPSRPHSEWHYKQ